MEDAKETFEEKKDEPMDVPDSSSSGSTSKDVSKTLPEEAFDNFLQGKRHMLVQDYTFAAQSLATACEMYVSHHGELAIECGEVYFLYGKALLRVSQQQAGVFGFSMNEGSNEDDNSSESEGKENASEKNSDGEEGDENEREEGEGDENEREEGEGDENEREEGEGVENEREEGGGDGDKEEKEPSESTDSPPTVLDEGSSEAKAKDTSKSTEAAGPSQPTEPADSSSSADGKTSEKSKTEENSEEPEEDDLELAWNALETAKSIFKRQNTVEAELKVAEILQLLAEISMESGNNLAAINDLQESLKIQKKHMKPDNRILAETYYQMGLAQMLEKMYPDALENFRTTKKILELRRENLKNTKVDDADGTFKSTDIQSEIADLDSILLDIQEKIDDAMQLITNKEKETKDSLEEAGSSSILMKDSLEKSTVNKPVSNITHLLKRKKPEEAVSEEGTKRIKTASVPNGQSKSTETKMAEG